MNPSRRDNIAIADLTQPAEVNIELADAGVNRRYGRYIRRLNWLDLVPPTLSHAGERARKSIPSVSCGFYYRFTMARNGAPAVTRRRWCCRCGIASPPFPTR